MRKESRTHQKETHFHLKDVASLSENTINMFIDDPNFTIIIPSNLAFGCHTFV